MDSITYSLHSSIPYTLDHIFCFSNRLATVGVVGGVLFRVKTGRDCGRSWRLLIERGHGTSRLGMI